jgi:hypothetical protein
MQLLGSRNPEISDLVHPIVEEDVGGFEVPVDDVEFVEVGETFTNLKKHINEFIQFTADFPFVFVLVLVTALLEEVTQIAAIAVLGNNIEEIGGLRKEEVTLSVASYRTILGWIRGFRISISRLISCSLTSERSNYLIATTCWVSEFLPAITETNTFIDLPKGTLPDAVPGIEGVDVDCYYCLSLHYKSIIIYSSCQEEEDSVDLPTYQQPRKSLEYLFATRFTSAPL